jgi:NDP-sugar pyrophosphorylase family protein
MTVASGLPVAILAGGLGTRLRPLTEKVPKSLLRVAGRPFLAHQLELLRRQKITKVVLCVGHLGELIQREVGDGTAHGLHIEYSFDGPRLLGTGGAIKRALPLLGNEFFVLYGDSYLPIEFGPVADFFRRSGKLGCMTVFRNEDKFDTSNVVYRAGQVIAYDKKRKLPEMHYIDYGLNVFKAAAFDPFPTDAPFDLADVLVKLVHENQLAGYEVHERFYEIGSPAGLAELEKLLSTKKAA